MSSKKVSAAKSKCEKIYTQAEICRAFSHKCMPNSFCYAISKKSNIYLVIFNKLSAFSELSKIPTINKASNR